MKFIAMLLLAATATVVAAVPDCANSAAIDAILGGASAGRCAIQTGFVFTVPVPNNASLTRFCSNVNCVISGDLNNLVPEECLLRGFNIKKEVLDKLKGRCNAPEVPRCENHDAIIRSSMQGLGGRCVVQSGFVLVQPVPDNALFDLFCASQQCQVAKAIVSGLVTEEECLVDGVLMKKQVLDKIEAGCAAITPRPDCPSN